MNIIVKTAWKNVWRNKVRSLVVIASVTVGIFAGVFAVAFMNGMMAQRFDAAFNYELSHIHIKGKNFSLNNDPGITISADKVTDSALLSVQGVERISRRTVLTGMAATASKNAGVQIVGIDPEQERKILRIHETLLPGSGNFFEAGSETGIAVIGRDLAKELNIIRYAIDTTAVRKLRESGVPATVTDKLTGLQAKRFPGEKAFVKEIEKLLDARENAAYGSLIKNSCWTLKPRSKMVLSFLDVNNNQVDYNFRVGGVYDIKNTMFEATQVFVRHDLLCSLTGIDPGSCHQITLRISDAENTVKITEELRSLFPDLEISNWKEMQPDLAMMADYVHQIYGFFMVIILAALAFGIINTMLMAVLERTKELGMLTAIGMNRRKVFTMIMLESVFLSLVGGVSGMIFGKAVVILTAAKGINFEQYAEGIEAFGYSAHIYPEIDSPFLVLVSILIILTGILSSVYPAMKALKLDPAEAIRTE